MKKSTLAAALFWLFAQVLFAQPQPCGPTPAMTPFCDQACIICDINGFTGINNNPTPGEAPPGFCTSTAHHMQWIGFIAGSTNLTLNVKVFDCQSSQGYGLEVGIYKSIDCENFQLVSNCDGDIAEGETGVFTNTVPLTIGQHYYFVMDGNRDDVCKYTITVVSGTTEVGKLPASGILDGDLTVCPDRPQTYTVSPPNGAAWFSWRLDGQVIDAGVDTSTTITWATPGLHELCVTSSNVCDTAPPTCRMIEVRPVPVTNIAAKICPGNCWEGADTVICDPGIYQRHFFGQENCDSIVQILIERYPAHVTNLDLKICAGDTVRIGNQAFTAAGQYQVIMPDQHGCDSTVNAKIEFLPTSQTSLDLMICRGDTIRVGNAPFFESGQFREILDNQFGCDSTVDLALTVIVCEIRGKITPEPVACNGQPTGDIRFFVNDGTPPFNYVWERIGQPAPKGSGSVGNLYDEVLVPNLPKGTYFVTVTDNFGHTLILFGDVTEPEPLTANFAKSNFNGYQISCAGGSDGQLGIMAAGGKKPYRYQWSTGATTTQISGLPAGIYTCTVTDANDCFEIYTDTLLAPPPLVLAAEFTDPDCSAFNSGAARVTDASGGVPPYLYDLSGNGFGGDTAFDSLYFGLQTITLRDANGCETDTARLLPMPNIPDIYLSPDATVELAESTQIRLISNVPLATVIWSPTNGLSCADCPEPSAMPYQTTTYTVQVVSAVNGCRDSAEVTIRVLDKRDVFVPNVFSPTGDGVNEFFTVFGGPEVRQIASLEIWSRWGELVFRQENFAPNLENLGWDGSFRGKRALPGVYFWRTKLEFVDGLTTEMHGNVTLVR
ncbi:MAG: gliding motility-associated C-terminal domain-containing protein [Saprospiraceae bacterium]